MKKAKYFGLLLVVCLSLSLILSLFVACSNSNDVVGKYVYSSASYITVESFSGTDGRAIANNIVVSSINNGKAYTTPTGSYESLKATKSSSNVYSITITIGSSTVSGSFDMRNMKIVLDGRTYVKVK